MYILTIISHVRSCLHEIPENLYHLRILDMRTIEVIVFAVTFDRVVAGIVDELCM